MGVTSVAAGSRLTALGARLGAALPVVGARIGAVLNTVGGPVGSTLAVLALAGGPLLAWRYRDPAVLAAATTLAAAALVGGWWSRSARWAVPVAAAAATASLAVTAVCLALRDRPPAVLTPLVEVVSLTALGFAVVSRTPSRVTAVGVAGLTGLASGLLILRDFTPPSLVAGVGVVLFWVLPAQVGVTAGLWVRWAAARRIRAVCDARRAQRLELAQDLHDFVAHDVSEIVARAQTAQYLNGDDPAVAAVLRQIEEAGQRALTVLDRRVRDWHDRDDASTMLPVHGLADLPDLVSRFTSAHGPDPQVQVRLDLPTDLAAVLPREVGATVYRIVVEALTNVRRHAPAARTVHVSLSPDRAGVRLTVRDSGAGRRVPTASGRHRGGLGLNGLTGRVGALGGTLTAGPSDGGWQVDAWLPREVR